MLDFLKPCPFCGCNVKLKNNAGDYGYTTPSISIQCDSCNIYFSERTEKWVQFKGHIDISKKAKKDLIERWNTRKG